jgi:hypothetical protein
MWQLLWVEKIQNGGRCHGNQGIKWPPNTGFCIMAVILNRHSKPTMNINSQHHNLLINHISLKSEDFCIWRPFCTLLTMATATILNFVQLRTTSTSSRKRYAKKKNRNRLDKLCRSCHGNKKGGI